MLHRADARSREQRESDDGDFPEVDRIELADARLRIDAPLDVRKPIDSPSIAPARSSASSSRPRATSGMSRPRA